MNAAGGEGGQENGQKKNGKSFTCYRDLLATVGLDFSCFIESVRLLLATLVSSFFSDMFIFYYH
jgi:hypothetical protein